MKQCVELAFLLLLQQLLLLLVAWTFAVSVQSDCLTHSAGVVAWATPTNDVHVENVPGVVVHAVVMERPYPDLHSDDPEQHVDEGAQDEHVDQLSQAVVERLDENTHGGRGANGGQGTQEAKSPHDLGVKSKAAHRVLR